MIIPSGMIHTGYGFKIVFPSPMIVLVLANHVNSDEMHLISIFIAYQSNGKHLIWCYIVPVYKLLTLLLAWRPFYGTYTNSADPDLTPQNVAYDQGLHCLLTECSIEI